MLKFLPGKSIQTQLNTVLLSLTAASIVILSAIALNAILISGARTSDITKSAMKQRVQQFLVQTTNATASKNALIFTNIQNEVSNAASYTKNVLLDPADFPSRWKFDQHIIRASTGAYTNSSSDLSAIFIQNTLPITSAVKQEFEQTTYLDDLFPQILNNEPNAVDIYFEGPHGETRYYPNLPLATLVPGDYDPSTSDFFVVANPQNDPTGVFKWSKVYDDPSGHGLVITAAQPIYHGSSFIGMVEMDVTLSNIGKNIEDYSPIESSYAFLIDNAGRAVALPAQGYEDLLGRAPKKDEFGTSIANVSGDLGKIISAMRAGKQGFASARAGGSDLYAAYTPVSGTPFSLAIVARQSSVLKAVLQVQNQVQASTNSVLFGEFLPLGIITVVLVGLIGATYIRFLAKPLNQLSKKTAEVARGNLEVEPTVVKIDNEVGQLARSFNDMVSQLRSSRQKIEEQNEALLHSEQTRLKASIESLHAGFIMTDNDNRIFLINSAAQSLLGAESVHKFTLDDIDHLLGPKAKLISKLQRAVETGESIELHELAFHGQTLSVSIAPILEKTRSSDERKLGAVILIEDITEAKNVERNKDEFFSIASHELRTPLTAIRGNTAMIRQFYAKEMKNPGLNEMVEDIHESSVRLIHIVNDFLDASRLEQSKVTFKPEAFPIVNLLEDVIDELGGVLRERHLYLKKAPGLDRLPLVFADKDRIKQVFYNLIGNSLKFVDQGGITVKGKVEGKMVKLYIIDTGRGISSEVKRALFQKFHTSMTALAHDGSSGAGLGLYISRMMVGQMGGTVTLESSVVGKGSTFCFTIPIAKQNK